MQIVVRPMGWGTPQSPQIDGGDALGLTGAPFTVGGFGGVYVPFPVLSSVAWHPKVPQALNDAYGFPVFAEVPAGITLTDP